MPFSANRNKRKAYYEKFALKAKLRSNRYYDANRVSVISKVLEQKRLVRQVNPGKVGNPQKAADATTAAVQKYRVGNPQKAADATSAAVQKYRVGNPQKAADATRIAMQKYRVGNPKKAAAAVQNYRLRNPAYSKAQNRHLVSAHYHKNTKQSRLLSRTSTAKTLHEASTNHLLKIKA